MVQLDFLAGAQAGGNCVARRFPFRVGRKPSADLVLQEDGIWDDHLELRIQGREVVLDVLPGGRAFVNDEPVESVALASGDVITLGAVRMRFGLHPPTQRGLVLRETLTWCILPLLFLSEAVILGWLLWM